MSMLDMFDALAGVNDEAPAHMLLRPIAAFFGYKFDGMEANEPAEPKARKKNQPGAVMPVMAAAGKTQSGDAVPHHIRSSKKLKEMFEQLKEDEKAGR